MEHDVKTECCCSGPRVRARREIVSMLCCLVAVGVLIPAHFTDWRTGPDLGMGCRPKLKLWDACGSAPNDFGCSSLCIKYSVLSVSKLVPPGPLLAAATGLAAFAPMMLLFVHDTRRHQRWLTFAAVAAVLSTLAFAAALTAVCMWINPSGLNLSGLKIGIGFILAIVGCACLAVSSAAVGHYYFFPGPPLGAPPPAAPSSIMMMSAHRPPNNGSAAPLAMTTGTTMMMGTGKYGYGGAQQHYSKTGSNAHGPTDDGLYAHDTSRYQPYVLATDTETTRRESERSSNFE